MQNSETESDKASKSDEDLIHFRPSPNFKHMKKYLKFKFEESLNQTNDIKISMSTAANKTSEASSPKDEKKVRTSVQPPLPPNPPPPDSPPLLTPKKELENDGYKCEAEGSSEDTNECKTIKPEVIMCRNYIRGTCTKGAACKFTHEQILSQLPGVYTFCKNFQNSVCVRPKCKFVHASVFEKEHFLRTGYLPPHVFEHLKESNAPQPPLPPPEGQVKIAPVYTKPHPPPPSQVYVAPLPTLTYPNSANATAPATDMIRNNLPASTSPKRKWSEIDEPCNPPCDVDVSGPPAKKCKHCGSNEFRFVYVKNKIEKLKKSSEELNQEIAQITMKHQRLQTLLQTLLLPKKSAGTGSILNGLDLNGEKDEDILEQSDFLLGGNNILSQLAEDTNKNLLLNNMSISNLLTTLLLYSEEPTIQADAL